jgi:hypothetical protein
MKKINMISRILLGVLAYVIFSIMFINEDKSWHFVTVLYSLIVFGLSFPSTIFANKIIDKGNKIDNKISRIVYYISIPIVLFGICIALYMGILALDYIFTAVFPSNDFASSLSQALMFLFIIGVMVIVVILPYIQALIINILKLFIK